MLLEIGLFKKKKKQKQKNKKQKKTKSKQKQKQKKSQKKIYKYQNCIKSGLSQFLFLQQKI